MWHPISFQQIKKQYNTEKLQKDLHKLTDEIASQISGKSVFGLFKINDELTFIPEFKGQLKYVYVKHQEVSDDTDNKNICLKWLDNPCVNPVTGRKILKNGIVYKKLSRNCSKIYPDNKKNISFTDSCTCQQCGKIYSLKESSYKLSCCECQNSANPNKKSLWGYTVDKDILGIIDLLNKHGVKTSNSSQCINNEKFHSQVWIEFDNYASFNLFVSKCLYFNQDFYDYLSSPFVDKLITLDEGNIRISIYFDNKEIKWFYDNILFLDL